MEAIASARVILVIADSNFVNLCDNPQAYMERFKTLMSNRPGVGVKLYTVNGKYGLSHIDPSIDVVALDDRNKTIFGQTLENCSMLFDELLMITMCPTDPFMTIAKEVMMNASKTITQYGYNRK